MTTTTLTKNPRTVIASASNAAGATVRGAIDLRTAQGGILTLRITNGGTGPTAQCVGRVMIAHDSGTTPATGAAGATWKQVFYFGGGTTANADTWISFEAPEGAMHLQVEFSGNTGQAVTVEAYFGEVTSESTA